MTLKVSSVSCFRSGYKIIDNISFELKAGQLALISGSNGSGKTSLLRMIAGFIPLSFGSITFNSKEDYSNEFFILGHNLAIKDDISPEEDIKFWSMYLGSGYEGDVLDRVGLRDLKKTPCKYLSQGQRQRLVIARLLSSNKDLWLLDEPTSSLDKDASIFLKEIINDHKDSGGSILVSSHINFLDTVDVKINLDNKNVLS